MTQVYAPSHYPSASPPALRGLNLVALWQALVGLAGIGAVLLLILAPSILPVPAVLRYVLAFLMGMGGLASLISVPMIFRRDHRGRVIALAVNFLSFIALFFYDLHLLGVFTGLDAVADTFPRGLPFLGGMIAGFVVTGMSNRYSATPGKAHTINRIGLIIMGVSGILMLLVIGLLPGLIALVSRIFASPLPALITLFALLFGGMAWFWWRTETGLAFRATITHTEMLDGYLLLSPNLLGFLVFFAGPLLFSLYVSFTEWSAFGSPQWIGLANYQEILGFDVATLSDPAQRASEVLAPRHTELTRFSLLGRDIVLGAKDKLFWIALRNTFVYCLLVVPLSVIPALVLANVLNSKLRGMRFYRAIYFLPSVAAVVGVAVIWRWLYDSTTGFINYGITSLVELVNLLPGLSIMDPQVRWLSQSDTALLSIVLMSAWRIIGFNTVLFLAGLQGISREVYEAAEVDGAGIWRKFLSITIPLLGPTTFFVVTTTIIQALQVFDEIIVMMNPPAGPNNATLTAVLYLYQNGFQRFNLGYASAVAWVLFAFIFMVTLVQLRIQRRNEGAF